MLSYLYDLIMSFVTLILGFFGIDMKKKSVSFSDETDKKDTPEKVEPVAEVSSDTE